MNHDPDLLEVELPVAVSSQGLAAWVALWSGRYKSESDTSVLALAATSRRHMLLQDLVTIFRWKLQPNHFVAARRSLLEYDADHPGWIRDKTEAACAASSDDEALRCLRGLPQMKTAGTVAVASAVLMVLDPNRWSVMDRMANKSLIALRDELSTSTVKSPELGMLTHLICAYAPPSDFSARSDDWAQYMAICREIAHVTVASLRTVDRALYKARGDLRLRGLTGNG
jgi:hypothetical protein